VFVSGKAKEPPTKAQLIAAALARRNNVWDLAESKAQLRIAQADAAGDPTGNAVAYELDASRETDQIRAIRAILANPAKALGVKGATLTRQQRSALTQALASAISQRTSDLRTAFDLRHPAADDSGAAGDDGSGGDGSTDTTPSADFQAQLNQANARAALATRGGLLSEAALKALTSSGDIGESNYANALGAGGGPLLVLGDARSFQAIANASNQGNGMQPSISSTRDRIVV